MNFMKSISLGTETKQQFLDYDHYFYTMNLFISEWQFLNTSGSSPCWQYQPDLVFSLPIGYSEDSSQKASTLQNVEGNGLW